MRRERRLYQRFPVRCELTGRTLSQSDDVDGSPSTGESQISGAVHDIGAGGLCLRTGNLAETSQPLRCHIHVPQLPVGIPTLLQVRWVHRDAGGDTYQLGLQYLL